MKRALPLGRIVHVIGWSATLMSGFVFLVSAWLLQEAALGEARLSGSLIVMAIVGIMLGGAGLILARLVPHWLHLQLVQPLVQLVEVLNAVQRGGLNSRFKYPGRVSELRELAAGSEGIVSYLTSNLESLGAENLRTREAYDTMLHALEDTAALTEELRHSEQRYRELAEAMPLMIWTATSAGHVDYFNGRWAEYTGVSIEQLLGWGWQQVLHPDDVAPTTEVWQRALSQGTPYHMQLRVRSRTGEYRWHLVRALPVFDGEGRLVRWIGATIDVEDQKRASDLEAANAELRELDRLKDQFLSIISHELRTPINAIMGFGSILEDEISGPLTDEQHAYLRKILTGADSLLTLVNDLLDMSRIQAGKLSLEPRPVDLHEVVAAVLEQLAPLATKKAHQVLNEVPDDPLLVHADEQRLAQILINLVNNAIKFTPEGGCIVIRACRSGEVVCCEVQDNGPGIGPEDRPRLFQQFGQLDQSYTRKAGGTGLGLAISRGLVEAHGGEIGVDSEPGEGSTFWFCLPQARSQ